LEQQFGAAWIQGEVADLVEAEQVQPVVAAEDAGELFVINAELAHHVGGRNWLVWALTLNRGVGEMQRTPLEMPALCPAADYLDGMEKTGCSQALTRTRTPTVRHPLNHGGNRQLNRALYTIAITQIRGDTEGRTYYRRKRAEGKTSRQALRCLKRRLSDLIYRTLRSDLAHLAELPPPLLLAA
jgi:hypothetical protein